MVVFKKYDKLKMNIVPLSEGLGKNEIEPLYRCESCGATKYETSNINGKELCDDCAKKVEEQGV